MTTVEVFGRRVAGPYKRLDLRIPAAEARAAVQEAAADCAIAESLKLRPVVREFVRQAASARHLFRRALVDNATGTERVLTWSRALVGAWALRDWLAPRLGPGQNVAVWLPTGLGSALTNVALGMLGRSLLLGGGARKRHKAVERKLEVNTVNGQASSLEEENSRLRDELAGRSATRTDLPRDAR